MPVVTPFTIITVVIIAAIAIGSVVLISKVGGNTASKKIRHLHGIDDDKE
ncbi:MAG: hypothetical protein NC253_15160 [Ruminococcus sp.]|nr:hypothetical protein [Ruminococcus sp.]MCM1382724.1 hypothetical protein [Muribaculaceae bacterium]MCM1480853.1 hypothetical protein [Muribaculaceae bacterium]